LRATADLEDHALVVDVVKRFENFDAKFAGWFLDDFLRVLILHDIAGFRID